MLCLNCFRTSPAKPAKSVFCTNCSLSLGGRVCDKGHFTPQLRCAVCGTCGSRKLSTGAAYIPLALVSRILAPVVFVLLLRGIWPYLPEIGRASLWAAEQGTLWMLGSRAGPLVCLLYRLAAWATVIWMVGCVLAFFGGKVGDVGKRIARWPLDLAGFLLRQVPALLRLLARGIARLIWPPPPAKEKDKKP